MAKAPKKIGRPSSFTPELGAAICERLALGESLREICASDDMPCRSTVMNWLVSAGTREELGVFLDQYTRAREAQAETIFDEILEIADDATNDWMERRLPSGETIEVVNQEHIQRSRLRIDSRKWMAAKLQPKKYGDRIDVTSGGEKIQREAGETEKFSRLAALMEEKRNAGLLPDFSGGED